MVGGWTGVGRLRPLPRAGRAEEGGGGGPRAWVASRGAGPGSGPELDVPSSLAGVAVPGRGPSGLQGRPCQPAVTVQEVGRLSGERENKRGSIFQEMEHGCAKLRGEPGVRRQQKPRAGGGSSAQRIPSRSGSADTVTGCKVLKWAFRGSADGRHLRPARRLGARPPRWTPLGAAAGVGDCELSSERGEACAGLARREGRGWPSLGPRGRVSAGLSGQGPSGWHRPRGDWLAVLRRPSSNGTTVPPK